MKIKNCPKHVGIIMDGNGRWATERGLPRSFGHKNGAEVVRGIVQSASNFGIETLTLYAFSTENWRRPRNEVTVLMRLFRTNLIRQADDLDAHNVRIRFIGQRDQLPKNLSHIMDIVEERTATNTGLLLQIALNYGSRREIINAVKSIVSEVDDGMLHPDDIDDEQFSKHLQTAGVPDPDLIIRTSGEKRISNFLLWQLAYSELMFVNEHWPDFNSDILKEVLISVASRNRRFGSIKEEFKA
jgi:undecaprenyl diphosphate synthase